MTRLSFKLLASGASWSLGFALCLGSVSVADGQEPATPSITPLKVEPLEPAPAPAPDSPTIATDPAANPPPPPPAEDGSVPAPPPAGSIPVIEPLNPAPPIPTGPVEPAPATAADLADQIHQAELETTLAASEQGTETPASSDAFRVTLPLDDDGNTVLEEGALAGPFDGTRMFPTRPNGFDGGIGHVSYHPSSSGTRHYAVGAELSLIYDSNVYKSGSIPDSASKDDVIFTLTPRVALQTLGRDWVAAVSLELDYKAYMENDNFGGLDYDLQGRLAYLGPHLTANLSGDISKNSGGNRYTGAYLEQTTYHTVLASTYRFSPKTVFDADLNFRQSESTGTSASDTQGTEFKGAVLWNFSPLLQIGPGIRYKLDSGSKRADRTTWGPLLRSRYRFTDKIALNADISGDFYEYSGASGGSGTTFHTAIEADYRLSQFWNLRFALLKDSTADEAISNAYRDTLTFRAGVERHFSKATLDLSAGYESSTREFSNGSDVVNGDTDSIVIESLLSMPLFRDRADAGILLRWRSQDGTGPASWSSTQIGVQISADY